MRGDGREGECGSWGHSETATGNFIWCVTFSENKRDGDGGSLNRNEEEKKGKKKYPQGGLFHEM